MTRYLRNWKKLGLALVCLAFVSALSAAPKVDTGKPPDRLSDLYKLFTMALSDGLGTEVKAWPVRILGRSWELLRDAKFPEVELVLRPFEAQELNFEKAEILFKRMVVDRDALLNWKISLKEVREVETRLIFSMRSLSQKLSKAEGQEVELKADAEMQTVHLKKKGRFFLIPCTVESDSALVWDEETKRLSFEPQNAYFGGHRIWKWLWWLGSDPAPTEPILDLGFSWIPFNIQEVHVSWDRVNLTTNW